MTRRAIAADGSGRSATRLILLGTVLYFSINLVRLAAQELRLLGMEHELQTEYQSTMLKAEQLRTDLRKAKTPAGIEHAARELGLVYPGEILVQFTEGPPGQSSPASIQ